MWPRTIEFMLGMWLATSPFIFQHDADDKRFWCNDLIVAFFVITLSLLSFWRPTRHAHRLTILIGIWLAGFGYLSAGPSAEPAAQNELVIGLLLLMLAIIPNEASLPPEGWREQPVDSA